MINFRIIARAFSQVLILEGLFMLTASFVSYVYGESAASSFLFSAIITLVTGILVFTPLRNTEKVYGTREGYIIVTGIWLIFCAFSTLPFLFSGSVSSLADAFFESMSGFTTTNATIFTDVESLPRGILFWRSLIQWLGGLNIILLSMYILPVIKTINIQLPTSEFSGQITDKIHPRIVETGKRLAFVYIILTALQILLLLPGKLSFFDAVCHSFSTVSTGGFSTHNDGIAGLASPYLMIVITVFMFLAGTNPALAYLAWKGSLKKITGNNEFIFYTVVIALSSLIAAIILFSGSGSHTGGALLTGIFHVISIISTTGFYTENYSLWPGPLVLIIFVLMFAGGMTGSAAGGIKMIRILIISRTSRKEIKRLLHPNAYLPVHVDRKTIPHNYLLNLLLFIALYFMTVCAGALIISFMDFDIITSFSTSASLLGNIGPGLGSFGPFTDFSLLPVSGKLFLTALMLLGRLELLTVLILVSRAFYKR